jgi:two-component system, NtrC family, response regulator HydG
MAQILVIEDNLTMREGIVQILSRAGHDVRAASGGIEGVELFQQSTPDFVISDLKMEDLDGIAVLRKIRELSPDALVMIITAFGTIEVAVEAMRLGAYDFITKPFPPELLRVKVAGALEFARIRAENQYFQTESRREHPDTMTGQSRPLAQVREQIARAAPTDSTVLVTGESGTGKELVARAIHAQSKRSHRPFIKVDCAALAEGVLESELFGHERGAFTGAVQRKQGRFELADGGTIFLDEIGEVSPAIQLKLLRVLQDRCFERVGGNRTLKVDVRVISATNRDLQEQIRAGRFREDLYYRLHIVPIDLPPLRDRRDDIASLTAHFLDTLAKRNGRKVSVTQEVLTHFRTYRWPGNIRELENLLERLYVLTPGDVIDATALPDEVTIAHDPEDIELPSKGVTLDQALETLERQLILRAYEEASGVKTKTAQLLGIKTSALYYKLEKYGIAKE